LVIELGGLVFEITHNLAGDLFRAKKNAGVKKNSKQAFLLLNHQGW
jgi:hypothetical protein